MEVGGDEEHIERREAEKGMGHSRKVSPCQACICLRTWGTQASAISTTEEHRLRKLLGQGRDGRSIPVSQVSFEAPYVWHLVSEADFSL